MMSVAGMLAVVSALAGGCGTSPSAAATGKGGAGGSAGAGGTGGTTLATGGTSGTLYAKYGTSISKIVDDAVAAELADCVVAPYFAVVGTPGHDSVARLKSCLRLQFTALMGGPATYPGKNDQGDICADMQAIHTGLGIPGDVFDKFIADVGAVLVADGVNVIDASRIAAALIVLRPQIVSSTPVTHNACDGGTADAATGQ
jgi:hypothetical protein